MKDLFNIIVAERSTLAKGLVICFLIILPFTFLPTIFDKGFTLSVLIRRLPDSILYAFGFALFIVIAAFIHNYNSLVDRKRIFDQPAFNKLGFYGRIDGKGSITYELETFLLGKIGDYYFRLNLIDPELKYFEIEIIPLIDIEEDKNLKARLKQELSFREGNFFGQRIKVNEAALVDENFLLYQLTELEQALKRLGVKPLVFSEADF